MSQTIRNFAPFISKLLLKMGALIILLLLMGHCSIKLFHYLTDSRMEQFDEGTHYGLTIGDSYSEVLDSLNDRFGDIELRPKKDRRDYTWLDTSPRLRLQLSDAIEDPSLLDRSPYWVWWPYRPPIMALTVGFTEGRLTEIWVVKKHIMLH